MQACAFGNTEIMFNVMSFCGKINICVSKSLTLKKMGLELQNLKLIIPNAL